MTQKKYESAHQPLTYIIGVILGLIFIKLEFGELFIEGAMLTWMIWLAVFIWLHTRMKTLFLKEDGIYTHLYCHNEPRLLVEYDSIEKIIVYRKYGDITRMVIHTVHYASHVIHNDYYDFQSFVDYLSVTLHVPLQEHDV